MSKQTRRPPSLVLPPSDAVPLTKTPMSSALMMKYLRRSPQPLCSPLSAAKVVDDDCLVMDGITVAPKSAGNGGYSSSSSGSGGSWPRHGLKFQFAHEEEDISPINFLVTRKTEAPTRNSYTTGSPLYGPKYHLLPLAMAEATGAVTQAPTSSRRSGGAHILTSFVQPECSHKTTSSASKLDCLAKIPNSATPEQFTHAPYVKGDEFGKLNPTACKLYCWSPLDDGIEISLPSQIGLCPSRDEVDAQINSVLYGPTTRKRLPFFSELSCN